MDTTTLLIIIIVLILIGGGGWYGRGRWFQMQTHWPVFHAEYWVYVLAAVVIVVLGTLLYAVDRPIKFSSWFL